MNKFLDIFKYKSNIDKDIEYKFNVYSPKHHGFIFVLLVFVLPMFFGIILQLVLTFSPIEFSETITKSVVQNVAASVFQFICTSIAMFLLYKSDRQLFWKVSGFGIFLFILAPVIFSIVLSSLIVFFIASTSADTQEVVNDFLSIISMALVEIAIGIFMLKKVVDLKARIIQTLKKNWKSLIVVVLVASLLVIGISYLASFLSNLAYGTTTENQASLEALLNNDSKIIVIVYAILLFFFTVVIAPFVEELTMRDSIFTNCGNKWVGLVVSTLYFAMSHVYLVGEMDKIWIYLLPSFILSLTFVYTKGNVTYSWLIHMINNLFSYILIIIGVMN